MSQSGENVASQSPSSSRVLTASYLEKHKNKKDLVRRLSTVANILRSEEVEADSPEYPGLAAMSSCLAQHFLEHRDKEVRLYAVLCCMELFAIYAPQAPWCETEIYYIFQQTIRQLANLAHTTQPSHAHYQSYIRILELLATVNIGVVLVELVKTAGDDPEHCKAHFPDNPMELLAELFKTTLQSQREQHPAEVHDYSEKCLIGCLEEYHGMMVPIPILDEILICLSQGPTITVTVPGAPIQEGDKRGQASLPRTEERKNPSYHLAKDIIRKLSGKFHNDVATLLNGLINNEAHFIENSSIGSAQEEDELNPNQSAADVWSIVYELNQVSPAILTTVIGTVSGCLETPEFPKRQKVVQLLGRLFSANNSRLASKFNPCFRQWLRRHVDIEWKIRLDIVHALTCIIKVSSDSDIISESEEVLIRVLNEDKKLELRLEAIHSICDLVYDGQKKCPVSPALLQAVGERVKSREKTERRDALTGLAQIYFRHFICDKLEDIQNAGDDCDIELVMRTLTDNCNFSNICFKGESRRKSRGSVKGFVDTEQDLYRWIPRRVFEALYYSDEFDSEMRSRVIQIIDDLLLGSDLSKSKNKKLTATARAVGLTIILDSTRDDDANMVGEAKNSNNVVRHLAKFLRVRAFLQNSLSNYIDARSKIEEYESDTEARFSAEARAMERLEAVAMLLPKPSGASTKDVLNALHSARDKHIFRILASITDPNHSKTARSRSIEELPKRAKPLGDPVASWLKTLARRCTMGDFISAEIIQHCVLLAQECFHQGDIESCVGLLSSVKFTLPIFPSICNDVQSFSSLAELFSECQSIASSNSKQHKDERKLIIESDVITMLSSLLSTVCSSFNSAKISKELLQEAQTNQKLKELLLQLCVRDGTPEQSRHAVETMAMLLRPVGGNSGQIHQTQSEAFGSLLKELTLPSKLTLSGSASTSTRIVSILSALSGLADSVPSIFGQSARGETAIRFALEAVLMGRSVGALMDDDSYGSDDTDDENEDDESSQKKTPKCTKPTPSRKGKSSVQHKSPTLVHCLLENDDLSITCRRACAAIEFLVSYIRSSLLAMGTGTSGDFVFRMTSERIQMIFAFLIDIIRNQGLPPSIRDRKECKSRQDRAAMRQCATVQLLRLCDPRLKLEKTYLSPDSFQLLAGSFLDEEKVVREAVIDELILLLSSGGVYREKGRAGALSVRFLALVALCVDGEHSTGHSRANGGAANIGKKTVSLKMAAVQCVKNLRRHCDIMYSAAKANMGQSAEAAFEISKLQHMPEYVVPFCYHMLAFRRETPITKEAPVAGQWKIKSKERNSVQALEEGQQKILRKRLKSLFDPLIHSLGDAADNISFLLQMTAALAAYSPVDESTNKAFETKAGRSPSNRQSLDTTISSLGDSYEHDRESCPQADAKMKTICSAAREVLLSFVKKDRDLSDHPGDVHVPESLFRMVRDRRSMVSENSSKSAAETETFKRTLEDPKAPNTVNSSRSTRSVTFSPQLALATRSSPKSPLALGVSPIPPRSSGGKSQKSYHDPQSEQETRTLSPGLTDEESPISMPSSVKKKNRSACKSKSFSKPTQPLFSSPSLPTHTTSNHFDTDVQTTSESIESEDEKEPPKKKKATKTPIHVKIGKSSTRQLSSKDLKRKEGKENTDVFAFEDDLEMSPPKVAKKRKNAKRKSPDGGHGEVKPRRALRSRNG